MGDKSQRLSERQRREELVANYLQRYCVKNDSIGFFGPLCWARFADQEERIKAKPGAGLLETRGVYFEGWCIDALAEKPGAKQSALALDCSTPDAIRSPRGHHSLYAGGPTFSPFGGAGTGATGVRWERESRKTSPWT